MPSGHRVLLVLVAAAVTAACSVDRDEPAAVTVPRMNTTTTTAPDGTMAPPPPEAQPLEPSWVLQVGGPGDESLVALTTLSDELVAVGAVSDPDTESDVFGITADTSGTLRTTLRDGTDTADDATAVASDGLDVLTCGTTGGAFGGPSGGATDIWCAQLTEDRQLGEIRQLGGPGDERLSGLAMDLELTHGYAAGSAGVPLPGAEGPGDGSLGDDDALMLQLRPNGTPEWARQFGTILSDAATGVTVTENGDGVAVGTTAGALEGPPSGPQDAWISRFDRSGRQRWTTQVGSGGSDRFDDVVPLGEARRGTEQYVAVGSTDGDLDAEGPSASSGGVDVAVASFGPPGDLQWLRQFGSDGEDRATAAAVDGSTVYVAGSTNGDLGELIDDLGPGGGVDAFLAAVDAPTGEVLWVSRFGSDGDDLVTSAVVTADGLLVLSGTTSGALGEEESGGGTDGFLIAFPLDAAAGSASRDV